jgi:hypothetical protein
MSIKLDKTKNDVAWESLFETHKILEVIKQNGAYKISAKLINEKREARLMTKFDHSIQLPKIFKENNLSIQPDSRGTYVIGNFESYKKIPKELSHDVQEIEFPRLIETLDPVNIYSESASILCAFNTGIIEDLLQQKVLFTVSGRMSTGKFSYSISSSNDDTSYEINVKNSQCEIDGGFEGEDIVAIIEAKNQLVNDFLIRQLYYPYRLWTSKTSKKVIPIFLSYSNDIFSFYVYKFKEDNNYNSIELVSHSRYQIGSNDIDLEDIISILEKIKIDPEPKNTPFPQADVFPRVLDLLMQIHSTKSSNYAFDIRQAQYYTNAAIYLGLVQKSNKKDKNVLYSMTKEGVQIMNKNPKKRNLSLISCILKKRCFNQTLKLYIDSSARPSSELVINIMKSGNLNLSQTTIERRSKTVSAWVDWIIRLTLDNQIRFQTPLQ